MPSKEKKNTTTSLIEIPRENFHIFKFFFEEEGKTVGRIDMPGPSHSDGVLAELDVVAALEMTTGDAIVDAKIRALVRLLLLDGLGSITVFLFFEILLAHASVPFVLPLPPLNLSPIAIRNRSSNPACPFQNNLHSQKVRALMKSVNSLKDQLSLQKAQAKEHRRSSLIGGLRDKVREQELVADVLKTELQVRGSMSADEVNQFVIKRTLGGPKRFRPKSREELQNEQIALEKKMRKVMEKNRSLQSMLARGGGKVGKGPGYSQGSNSAQNQNKSNNSFGAGAGAFPVPPSPTPSTPPYSNVNTDALQAQISEQLDEVETLKVAVRSRDTNLAAQMQEMDRLRSENRELRRVEERLIHKERKHRDLKERNARLIEENEKLQEESEVVRADLVQVKAGLETTKEEAKIEADALRSQYGKQMDELATSLAREAELGEQLDKFKGEATASRQNNYELARTKEITLNETQKQNSELKMKIQAMELKNDKLEREIASLQSGSKESAVTKEKLRSEAQRSRELTRRLKEVEARLEDSTSRREKAESAVNTLKERTKSAESQNSKLHRDLEVS